MHVAINWENSCVILPALMPIHLSHLSDLSGGVAILSFLGRPFLIGRLQAENILDFVQTEKGRAWKCSGCLDLFFGSFPLPLCQTQIPSDFFLTFFRRFHEKWRETTLKNSEIF